MIEVKSLRISVLAKWLVSLTSVREVPGTIPLVAHSLAASPTVWPGMRVKCIQYTVNSLLGGIRAHLDFDVKQNTFYLPLTFSGKIFQLCLRHRTGTMRWPYCHDWCYHHVHVPVYTSKWLALYKEIRAQRHPDSTCARLLRQSAGAIFQLLIATGYYLGQAAVYTTLRCFTEWFGRSRTEVASVTEHHASRCVLAGLSLWEEFHLLGHVCAQPMFASRHKVHQPLQLQMLDRAHFVHTVSLFWLGLWIATSIRQLCTLQTILTVNYLPCCTQEYAIGCTDCKYRSVWSNKTLPCGCGHYACKSQKTLVYAVSCM